MNVSFQPGPFAIETFVGTKYGRWLRHKARYTTQDGAARALTAIEAAERKIEAHSFLRRVVPA